MAAARIDKNLRRIVDEYVQKINAHYPVDAVYLFGSHAHGTQHKDSDIDLAIFSKKINNRILDRGKIFALTYEIDANIEPHPFNTKECKMNERPIIDEILRYGILL